MAIDLRQFHNTFFDESLEQLAGMEADLLQLEQGLGAPGFVPNTEQLNRIFRAVHSIKGGSATFGFAAVAEFAHVFESLLDDIRAGRRSVDTANVGLLLRAVDAVRELVTAARAARDPSGGAIAVVRAELDALMQSHAGRVGSSPSSTSAVPHHGGWHIEFRPHPEFFGTGNDPLCILRELARLGPVRVTADAARLPTWAEFRPESCHLGWHIELDAAVPHTAVAEVFAWVTDDCMLTISPRVNPTPPSVSTSPTHDDSVEQSIRVATPKVDALINMVGELVITQSMLSQVAANFTPEMLPRLFAGLAQLERNTRELRDSVMRIRMLPLSFAFNRFPRLVRDVGRQLGKKAQLVVSGEHTELDKIVIERVSDPLLHLVRNCLDHGLETPAERRAAGKPETGVIYLKAYQKGANVIIEIGDDGHGLRHDKILAKAIERGLIQPEDKLTEAQIRELIFLPGFSTADSISDVSGRGVGMDVVRSNIASLGGAVEVASVAGQGVRFTVRLPLTLAILDGLSVQVGAHVYILPLVNIAESIRLRVDQVSRLAGGAEVFALRSEYLPLIRLYELFHVTPRSTDLSQGSVVVIDIDGKRAGIYVDELLGQQQVVIKNLEAHYRRVDGISAATILGDGTVAMILDVSGLIRLAHVTNEVAGFRADSTAALSGRRDGAAFANDLSIPQ